MKQRHIPFALALVLPLAVAACDDDDDVEFAVYRATLVQINPQSSQTIPAAIAEVIVEDDDAIQIRVEGLGMDAVGHPTFLRSGAACPTVQADVNADGIVDVIEGQAAYGTILLPFDANITTQFVETGTFPTGGSFAYLAIDDLDDVLDAVEGPDPNPNDFLVPLAAGEDLDLDTRTVVVHGVAPALLVNPLTVKGLDGMEIASTVPILCGRLARID